MLELLEFLWFATAASILFIEFNEIIKPDDDDF